jgi:hypothetical protein
MNLLPGRAAGGTVTGAQVVGPAAAQGAVRVGIRPEDLRRNCGIFRCKRTIIAGDPVPRGPPWHPCPDQRRIGRAGPTGQRAGPAFDRSHPAKTSAAYSPRFLRATR